MQKPPAQIGKYPKNNRFKIIPHKFEVAGRISEKRQSDDPYHTIACDGFDF